MFSKYSNLLLFPYKKNVCRNMEKKHKNPPGKFCSRVPIMHGRDSYSARSKYHLTIKNSHFTVPDFGGLAARLLVGHIYRLKASNPYYATWNAVRATPN